MPAISVSELSEKLALGQRLRLFDVRRAQALAASGAQIPTAQWLDPALWLDWKDGVQLDQPIVFYCAHGHEISQGLTAALRAMGADAYFLEGGFSAWQAAGGAVLPIPTQGATA